MGRGGDTILAHITLREAELLHNITDGGSINPVTGLPEFFLGDLFSGLSSSFSGIGESFMSGLDSFSDSLSSGLSSFGDSLSSGFDSLSDAFSSSSSKPKASTGSGLADALTGAKPKAMDEYGDFMKQLHDKNPGRAKGFEKDVLGRLSPDDRTKLGTYMRRVGPDRPAAPTREIKIGDRIVQKGSFGTDQLIGGAGKDDLSNGKNRPTGNQHREVQGKNRPSSGYMSPIHQEFRDGLNKIESDKDGYKAYNTNAGGIGAHGRYQMRHWPCRRPASSERTARG